MMKNRRLQLQNWKQVHRKFIYETTVHPPRVHKEVFTVLFVNKCYLLLLLLAHKICGISHSNGRLLLFLNGCIKNKCICNRFQRKQYFHSMRMIDVKCKLCYFFYHQATIFINSFIHSFFSITYDILTLSYIYYGFIKKCLSGTLFNVYIFLTSNFIMSPLIIISCHVILFYL